jgi:nucleotide-binding universal stress UspA family protein
MTAPILVGHDPASQALGPVVFAAAAAQIVDAPLIVVTVHGGGNGMHEIASGEPDTGSGEDARAALSALERAVPSLAREAVELRGVHGHSAAHGLHRVAEDEGAGLVVVGASHRGRSERAVLGSTAERVIHGAPCPVAVVPDDLAELHLGVVGVAFVPTPEGRQALEAGAAFSRATGARLRVVALLKTEAGAVDGPHADPRGVRTNQRRAESAAGHKLRLESEVAEALAATPAAGDPQVDVLFGEPERSLIDISRHLDVLVMGSRGYGPKRAVLLGGVSRRVVAGAACPVVVLPRGVDRPLAPVLERIGAAQ